MNLPWEEETGGNALARASLYVLCMYDDHVWTKDIILNKFLIALFISLSTAVIGLVVLYLPNVDSSIKKCLILIVKYLLLAFETLGMSYYISYQILKTHPCFRRAYADSVNNCTWCFL